MSHKRLPSPGRSYWTVLLSGLCIVLLLLGVTAQAVHTHPDDSIHGNCTLCVSVHAVPSITAVVSSVPLMEPVELFTAQLQKSFPHSEIFFALSIRPPPIAA